MTQVSRIFILSVVFFSAGWINPVKAHPPVPLEYQIKAVFIKKFIKFIEWPSEVLPHNHNPIKIGILGKSPIIKAFESGKTTQIKGHKLEIREFENLRDLEFCHILFIAASEKDRFKEILKTIQGKGVLTISETENFSRLGGIINFFIVEDMVRFAINVEAAEKAGLKISSKVLRLAEVVRANNSREKK